MEKAFSPSRVEELLYAFWQKSGLMSANSASKKKPYTIVLPPPNANANLHLGHAMYVYEDIMIRYHKLKGFEVLWLPGADHAGFETQYVFEKHLAKQDKSRFDYDRDTLYKLIWDFVQNNRSNMEDQLKKLGFFLDWSRKKFTLDEDVVRVVYKTFVQMFHDGLIYRENRLVNYCTHCGTSFSDLEVLHVERTDPLYYLKYGPFVLATVRPETKFGDTAIAVNPKDKRYKEWIGKEVEVEGLNGPFKLKVVGDDVVDPQFGTGVVKVTPAHDFTDFEIAKRHDLPFIEVINQQGKLTKVAGPYEGMRVAKARIAVVEDMKKKGLIEKIDETYSHTISTCYKCGRVLEPLLMPQWYVKVKPLAKKALEAIKEKKVVFTKKRFETSAKRWLRDFHDWNISRQIVWGIRIPAYKCESTGKWFVSETTPDSCQVCKGNDFKQDTDTFDTWFSSGQWPFATLMTTKPGDFDRFYPTSVMETGYDILPWWVCRMLMLGLYRTGSVPFEKVYFHGLIRDIKGQKMSKSKGNVINPLDLLQKYGADALRAGLVWETTQGNDIRMSDQRVIAMRNFANKIWNIGRFVDLNKDNQKKNTTTAVKNTYAVKLKKEFDVQLGLYKKSMEAYEFSRAFGILYKFMWHRYADFYIEKLKEELQNGNISVFEAMKEVYEGCLVMLHPFMPFVTEAIWKVYYGEDETIFHSTLLIK